MVRRAVRPELLKLSDIAGDLKDIDDAVLRLYIIERRVSSEALRDYNLAFASRWCIVCRSKSIMLLVYRETSLSAVSQGDGS